MKKWVIISTDINLDYAIYAYLTTLWWNHVGYETLILLVGNESQWNKSPPHAFILKHLTNIVWIPDYGYKTHIVAQVSRLYGAQYLNIDDYALTSDIDMWPIDYNFFNKPINNQFQISHIHPNKYEICYLGGSVKSWIEIFDTFEQQVKNFNLLITKKDLWCYDEILFNKKIQSWGIQKCDIYLRNSQEKRLEKNETISSKQKLIDIHLPKCGMKQMGNKHILNWLKARKIFELYLPEKLKDVDNYWCQFSKYIT